MRLVASDPAVDFIETHGGNLYIWLKKNRCGGGFHTLGTATEAPPEITFRRLDDDSTNFALFVPETMSRMPDELQVELAGSRDASRRTGTDAPGSSEPREE